MFKNQTIIQDIIPCLVLCWKQPGEREDHSEFEIILPGDPITFCYNTGLSIRQCSSCHCKVGNQVGESLQLWYQLILYDELRLSFPAGNSWQASLKTQWLAKHEELSNRKWGPLQVLKRDDRSCKMKQARLESFKLQALSWVKHYV